MDNIQIRLLAYIEDKEPVTFWWYDNVCFELDQHCELDF